MSSVITTGEPQKLFWIGETSYGVTPTGALNWGGDTLEMADKTDTKRSFNLTSGSRSFTSTTRGMMECGYTWKGYARPASGGYAWNIFFAQMGMGYILGTTTFDRLPPFSTQLWIKQVTGSGTLYQYFLYNGCKMNKLEMSGTSPGQPIDFNIDVPARWVSYSGTKAFTGLQTVTVGADPADPIAAATPICWTIPPQYNIASAGYVAFHPRDWKLTIDNHIVRTPGQIYGADASYYPVCNTLEEEARDIIFECTIPAQDQTFEQAKRIGSVMTGLKFYVDTKTLTLGTGYFEENDFPTYSQKVNDEKFRIRFQTLTMA